LNAESVASAQILLQEREKTVPFPSTETPGRLQAELGSRGIRLTRQRRAILQVIETADHHLDAAQILRWAQKIEPSVDRVTVYRTLSLLKKNGLVDELDLMHVGGEGHYYERVTGRDHLHITCLRCGKVLEFESPYLEKIRKEVEAACSFDIAVARLEIGGYCQGCPRAK
jgi:Fur family transcriptional regulator, ferric uptake regulator